MKNGINVFSFLSALFLTACGSESLDLRSDCDLLDKHLFDQRHNLVIEGDQLLQSLVVADRVDDQRCRPYLDRAQAIAIWTHKIVEEIDSLKELNAKIDERVVQKKIKKYKKDILSMVPMQERVASLDWLKFQAEFASNYEAGSPGMKKYLLGSLVNDVLEMQNHILTQLSWSIISGTFKFDSLGIRVVPAELTVKLGQDFRAEVFIAGMSFTSGPKFWIGNIDPVTFRFTGSIDSTSIQMNNGIGFLSVKATKLGENQLFLSGRIKNPVDGTILSYPCKIIYKVVK